ncbi:exopolysaccharide transport family protein [Terrarubrum flagellatum]|uniref:GumC family protein n=1 Tax=Terrirubrum flagellatum TaxID=2895980 RepID=UPI0031454442
MPDQSAKRRLVPGELDVSGLWGSLVRRRSSIIVPTLLLTAAAAAYVNVATPRYAGEARLLLESRVNYLNRPDRAQPDQGSQNAFDSEGVQSQVQVVMSNDLAREAIKKLKLIGNPEFDPSARSFNFIARITALLGISRDLTDRSLEDRVMEAYYDKLSVYPVGKSRVVGVEFSSSDPDLAANGANVIADLYLDTVATAKKDLARSAGTWLSGNIDDLRRRVKEAEAKVEEFRSRNGLFSAGRDSTLPQQQLAEAATQLSQARTQQADAQAKAHLIRDMIKSGRVFEITEVSNNELIRRLIEQRVTLRAQMALEARTLGSEHPRMKELSAQIADVEGQIRSAAERTVRGIENDAKVAGARVEQLQAALDEQKKKSGEGLENDVQLRALDREARTLREQLESYLAKYREAVARDTDNAEPPDARVISRAVVPSRPAFPKKMPIIVLTALASLVLFSAVAIARDLMGSAAKDEEEPEDAENVGAQPAFASARQQNEPVADHNAQEVSEPAPLITPERETAQDQLIERLRADAVEHRPFCIALIGADRAEAGDVVVEVANTLAKSERTIMVVLSDAIAAAGDRRAGVLDLARGEAGFAEVIRRAQDSRLHVMLRGEGDLSDLSGDSETFDTIFDALSETYDAVVIDAPFDLTAEERAALARHADRVAILNYGATADAGSAQLFASMRAALGSDPWVVLLGRDADVRTAA